MITGNAIHRTFQIMVGQSTGTCFTVDVDDKQYIVTAKHVIESISDSATISIFHDNQWKPIDVTLVGHSKGDIDVSVIATTALLSPSLELESSMDGIIYGQDVYFLGFPYGMVTDAGVINNDFPMPFVKKAIVSNITSTSSKTELIFLDGHNNPGFSGGPVIFVDQSNKKQKVAAIISGYRFKEEPIYQNGQEVNLTYKYNTGLIITHDIKNAIDLIKANPIGCVINA